MLISKETLINTSTLICQSLSVLGSSSSSAPDPLDASSTRHPHFEQTGVAECVGTWAARVDRLPPG